MNYRVEEDLLKIFNIKELSYLGAGEYGEAYLTDDGKVLKMTTDTNEFLTMNAVFKDQQERKQFNNSVYENSIEIHKVFLLDNKMFILMEHLDTNGVEDLFLSCMSPEIDEDVEEILSMDAYELNEKGFNKKQIKFIEDVSSSIFEMQKGGRVVNDIIPDNIGLNKYGNYVLFDQRNRLLSDLYLCRELERGLKNGEIEVVSSKNLKKKRKLKIK